MKKKIYTALGLMSGTSMDGVDLSIIKTDGEREFTTIFDDYFEFTQNLREKLINIKEKLINPNDLEKYLDEIREIEREFTLFNSQIISKKLKDYSGDIDLVGFHGQTVFHNSDKKITKQIGDGKLLSQLTKKIVVNNFRQEDLANGGEGAPLTPLFHDLITRYLNKKYEINFPMNIINIGGITNITRIFKDSFEAFDIAPGNCLIDEWVRRNTKKKYDENGLLAKSGKVDDLILNQALDNFHISKYTKSLDTKDFDISFVKGLSLEDGCATLTEFTAHLIANGIKSINSFKKSLSTNNLISGGGRKNVFLIESIDKHLTEGNSELKNIDDYGLDGDFLESQAFGFLAVRSFLKLPISFPYTTRCKTPTVGGIINKNF